MHFYRVLDHGSFLISLIKQAACVCPELVVRTSPAFQRTLLRRTVSTCSKFLAAVVFLRYEDAVLWQCTHVQSACSSYTTVRMNGKVFVIRNYLKSAWDLPLLRFYAAWNCNFRPTFRNNLSVPSLRVKPFLCLTLENGTEGLSRNVCNKPQFYPA